MNASYDVAIIGAGAAGVGAARALAGRGLSSVVVEAAARVGGRASTRVVAGLPLDLGCGWLHSADRNPWVGIAERAGFAVDRGPVAWGTRFSDLGFPRRDQDDARRALADWRSRLAPTMAHGERAADALPPDRRWTAYLRAMSGYVSGGDLERVSSRDYLSYDEASTGCDRRVPRGYGALVAASLPGGVPLRLATPVESVDVAGRGVALRTPAGTVEARAAIVSLSTAVLAGDAIRWPGPLDPWRVAATQLPLGRNEKMFLEIVEGGPFAPESHVIGDPADAATGTYYIRPFGRPVIECFLGGAGARAAASGGPDAAFVRAIDQLARPFGTGVRRHLKALAASDWAGIATVGGSYSYARPGQADARLTLARPFDGRLFFAGEATHATDFSTPHGAYASGLRAAGEAAAVLAPREIHGSGGSAQGTTC